MISFEREVKEDKENERMKYYGMVLTKCVGGGCSYLALCSLNTHIFIVLSLQVDQLVPNQYLKLALQN